MLRYRCAVHTLTGRRRVNQDNYYLNGGLQPASHGDGCHSQAGRLSRRPIFAVADGIGGEASGELASHCAVEYLAEKHKMLYEGCDINAFIRAMNDSVCLRMGVERGGSTIALMYIHRGKAFITNLGDSPIYLLRDGRLTKLTVDHTQGQMMLDRGVFTPEQLQKHPSRNILTRYLGILPSEMELETAEYPPILLRDGDSMLLCSDGLCEGIGEVEITSVLNRAADASKKAEELATMAYNKGSYDNITAMVVDIVKGSLFNDTK